MGRKYFVIIAIILGALGVVAALAWYSSHTTLFPSQQMQELRQLEAKLDLPRPDYRSEDDTGAHADGKGVARYNRSIALEYKDRSVLNILRAKLLEDSWREDTSRGGSSHADVGGPDTYFFFTKGSGSTLQCVGGFTWSKDYGHSRLDAGLYISLEAPDIYNQSQVYDACDPAYY